MAINSPLNIAAQPGKTRLRKSLKLWQVVMMGLAYLTPMTVFDTEQSILDGGIDDAKTICSPKNPEPGACLRPVAVPLCFACPGSGLGGIHPQGRKGTGRKIQCAYGDLRSK